jgi:hypothetical protein
MNNKILSCLTLLYLMIQATTVLANTDVKTTIADCWLNGKQCATVNVPNIPNNQSKHVESSSNVAQTTCNTQASRLREDIQWNKLTKAIANGESISGLLYALDNSTDSLAVQNEINAIDVDYDSISNADVQKCDVNVVPLPSAGWLFASSIIGFATFSSRRRV